MEQIRRIVRKQLIKLYESDLSNSNEEITKPGEYSTELMNWFMLKLFDLVFYSDKPEVYDIKKEIMIPSSWPASSVSRTGEEAVENWGESKRIYNDHDTKWYVWKTDISGNFNKPKSFSAQRLDFESILNIVAKNPEAFHSISIGVTNENIKNRSKNISTKGD